MEQNCRSQQVGIVGLPNVGKSTVHTGCAWWSKTAGKPIITKLCKLDAREYVKEISASTEVAGARMTGPPVRET